MTLANRSWAGASPDATHKEGKAIIQVASLFNQLLQHFPGAELGALVKENDAERCAKGFGCWTQLVSMLFCQLAHADSLREICNGLGCCLGKLVHLGIGKAPNKSTLSYANEPRPAKLYEDLFYTALQRFRDEEGLWSTAGLPLGLTEVGVFMRFLENRPGQARSLKD